ncbi:hypothetical protein CF319_g4043 [Tilletia indica]|nr:hypothetical protein CF319_g4043 [Tilletia indica]
MANPARDSVDKLLSDFDNLGTGPTASSANASAGSAAHKDAQSLLDDLDSLVQTPRPGPAGALSSAQAAPSAAPVPASEPRAQAPSAPSPSEASKASNPSNIASAASTSGAGAGANWGSWGTIWSSAARLADQARIEIEKRAPPLTVSGTSADGSIVTEEVGSNNVQEASANAANAANAAAAAAQGVLGRGFKFAEGVRGYVKESGWDKIGEDLTRAGRKGLKEIINAVAPPIAAHEVLQVTLSHDMIGYDGIETVVFQVLAKVMEQVEQSDVEHQLVVNKAPKRPGGSLPKQSDDGLDAQHRDLNAVEGFDAAFKLAEAELAALIKSRPPPKERTAPTPTPATSESTATQPNTATDEKSDPSTDPNALTLPITECPLFIRVQPVFGPLPGHTAAATATSDADGISKHLFFVIVLQDPLHGLRHQTVSQAVPWSWMAVPFETNAWVEQALVDVLQGALSIVGQDYVHGRSVAAVPASA